MEESTKELIEYLKIIWSKKWIIIVGTMLTVLVTVLVSFLITPVYEIDSILHPANISTVDEGGKYLQFVVEDPRQIVGKVMHGSFNSELMAEFQIPAKELPFLKAQDYNRTSLIRIWTRTTDINFGKRLLNSLINQIKADMDRKIDIEAESIAASITSNSNKMQSAQSKLTGLEKDLKAIERRKLDIQKDIESVKRKIEDLKKVQLLAPSETNPDTQQSQKSLLLSTEMRQSLSYYELLNNELNAELSMEQNMISKIEAENSQLKETNSVILRLTERKNRLEYTKVIKEPSASLYPIRPKKKLNAMAAFFLGLLVFTLAVFFVNYIEKNW